MTEAELKARFTINPTPLTEVNPGDAVLFHLGAAAELPPRMCPGDKPIKVQLGTWGIVVRTGPAKDANGPRLVCRIPEWLGGSGPESMEDYFLAYLNQVQRRVTPEEMAQNVAAAADAQVPTPDPVTVH